MASGRAADDVRAAIDDAGGAVPFSTFVELALYGPHGFYTDPAATGSAGRRGDFLTAPEVGPLFGAVVARFLDAEWERLERPDPFTVVDAGAGPGTLARAVLAARPACAGALRYLAVEVSASQRARHPADVDSVADAARVTRSTAWCSPTSCSTTCRSGSPSTTGRGARPTSSPGPTARSPRSCRPRSIRCRRCCRRRPSTAPAPRCRTPRRPGWPRRGASYGEARSWSSTTPARRRPRWPGSSGGRGCGPTAATSAGSHPLVDPGDQDITVDVALDQLPEPDAARSQAQFLRRWGIDELVEEGRQAWQAAATAPDLAAAPHAQPPDRGGCAARSGRPRRVQRRAVDCPDRLNGAR